MGKIENIVFIKTYNNHPSNGPTSPIRKYVSIRSLWTCIEFHDDILFSISQLYRFVFPYVFTPDLEALLISYTVIDSHSQQIRNSLKALPSTEENTKQCNGETDHILTSRMKDYIKL